jgi:hypothetical protein
MSKFPEVKFAFFDILGFKNRFAEVGLEAMLEKYLDLIGIVQFANEKMKSLGSRETDDALWLGEGKKFFINGVYGSYSSDSIVLWANNWFPAARGLSEVERRERILERPSTKWQYHQIPNDRFVETCNELLCHALSVGLPLRGALATGTAVIDVSHNIFLGQPLIDSVVLEGAQRVVGGSLCKSIAAAGSPEAYVLQHTDHLRKNVTVEQLSLFSGQVLDWPAHWSRTRDSDLVAVIGNIASGSQDQDVYDNTLDLIQASTKRHNAKPNLFDAMFELNYPQFQDKAIGLSVYPRFEGQDPHPQFNVRGV